MELARFAGDNVAVVRCPACGSEVSEWAARCPACGADTAAAEPLVEVTVGRLIGKAGESEVEPDPAVEPEWAMQPEWAVQPAAPLGPRRPSRLSVVIALAVGVGLVASLLAVVLGRHGHPAAVERRPAVTTPATTPVTPPVTTPVTVVVSTPPATSSLTAQPGARVVDLTWISNARGWALLSQACPSGTCSAILSTSDGGESWIQAPASPGVSEAADQHCLVAGCVEHLRYVSPTVGYLWGEVGLYMTVDGGQSWVLQPTSEILGLEGVQGWVIRVVAPGGAGSPLEVDRAAVGSGHWTPLTVPVGDFGGEVFTAGRSIYIAWLGHVAGGAPDAHTQFVRSDDGGATWKTFGDPCGTSGDGSERDAEAFAATDNGHLAVLCELRVRAGSPWFTMSVDSGNHFAPAQAVPVSGLVNTQIALASDGDVALIATTGGSVPSQVVRSNDAGKTWSVVLSAPPITDETVVPWFGFEDANTGRVSYGASSLWTTTDGGQSWAAVRVPLPS